MSRAHPGAHHQPRHLFLGELLDRKDVLPNKGMQQRGGLEVGCTLGRCLTWEGARWIEVAVLDHSWICGMESSWSADVSGPEA